MDAGQHTMDIQRQTGPGAGVMKYDLVTCLSVAGLNGPPVFQTSMMRLISLVTARYNWRQDELCVGQREMARMWSVNERTVKREVKRLTQSAVLICKRPGVKGRVATYRLNILRIVELSEPCWELVGPDFKARMQERHHVPTTKIVALQDYAQTPLKAGGSNSPWDRAMARLCEAEPSVFQSWFAKVEHRGFEHGVLTLAAPTRFSQQYISTHLIGQLTQAAEPEFGNIQQIVFV